MKATAQLNVPPTLAITLNLTVTVEEAEAILEATKDASRWPMHTFKEVLRQALSKATSAYHSEHVIEV